MQRLIRISSLVVLLCLMGIYNVSAAEQVQFDIKAKLESDSNLSVDYCVSKNSNIAALGFEVLYDSNALTIDSIACGSAAESGLMQWNDKQAGRIIVSYINTDALKDSGSVLSVKYNLLGSYDKKDIALSLNITEAVDSNYEAVDCVVNKSVVSNPNYQAVESTTEQNKESATTEKQTTPTATKNPENESDKDSYNKKEEVADKEIISEINKLLGNENHTIFSVDLADDNLYDKNERFEAVFGKTENGEIEKLTPSNSDDKEGAYYENVDKYEEVYIVEKDTATKDSVITIGELKQPDNNKAVIIILSALVILGVGGTLLTIKIKKKEGRKNEKEV